MERPVPPPMETYCYDYRGYRYIRYKCCAKLYVNAYGARKHLQKVHNIPFNAALEHIDTITREFWTRHKRVNHDRMEEVLWPKPLNQ